VNDPRREATQEDLVAQAKRMGPGTLNDAMAALLQRLKTGGATTQDLSAAVVVLHEIVQRGNTRLGGIARADVGRSGSRAFDGRITKGL
jgi:hypothetical protein